MSAVDDHRAATPTRGGTQPTAGLDPSTATDRLDTPAQGVRPEETPEVTPEGSEESPDRG